MTAVTENLHTVGNAHLIATYDDGAPAIGTGISPQFADISIQIGGDRQITLGKVFMTNPDDLKSSDSIERWKHLMTYATKTKRLH